MLLKKLLIFKNFGIGVHCALNSENVLIFFSLLSTKIALFEIVYPILLCEELQIQGQKWQQFFERRLHHHHHHLRRDDDVRGRQPPGYVYYGVGRCQCWQHYTHYLQASRDARRWPDYDGVSVASHSVYYVRKSYLMLRPAGTTKYYCCMTHKWATWRALEG